MKKIIVLTDFSECSSFALKAAASIAKSNKAGILVIHMLELNQALLTSAEGFHPEQSVYMIKLAEKRMKEFLDQPYLKDIEVTPIIKHYKVYSEVNLIAEEHGADFIIMGSHGSEGMSEFFVGSNAEKVVRHSNIPVLVLKEELKDFKMDRMVFACDFKDESLAAFQKAKEFATLFEASLEPVFINVPGEDFLSTRDAYERINKFLSKANASQQVEVYNDYSLEQGILNYGKSIMADIIGIPTHGRKGIRHFLMGSLGEDIVNHAKIPVITFKI